MGLMATNTPNRSQRRNISAVAIPDSGELRAIAVLSRDSHVTFDGSVPTELLPLALEVVALTRKLQMKCTAYDQKRQCVKVRTLKANGEATREILAHEREQRVAKEAERLEKRERIETYKKLSPMEKRFYRQTGLTPQQQLERMMEEAKKFMAGFSEPASDTND